MWSHFRNAPNRIVAEMWQELLECEGVPVRVLPSNEDLGTVNLVGYRVYVPVGKEHVAEEVLRKI